MTFKDALHYSAVSHCPVVVKTEIITYAGNQCSIMWRNECPYLVSPLASESVGSDYGCALRGHRNPGELKSAVGGRGFMRSDYCMSLEAK